MFDFFKSLFRTPAGSGETAKERLRLVLLSDHLSLAPEVVDALKRDLMDVISRYVEIDSAHADVTFEHREREIAMLASIPITGVRGHRTPAPAPPVVPTPARFERALPVREIAPPEPAPAEAEPEPAAALPEPEPVEDAPVEPQPVAAPKPRAKQKATSAETPVPARASNAAAPRRRRRKRSAAAAAAAAAGKRAPQQQQLGAQAPAQT